MDIFVTLSYISFFLLVLMTIWMPEFIDDFLEFPTKSKILELLRVVFMLLSWTGVSLLIAHGTRGMLSWATEPDSIGILIGVIGGYAILHIVAKYASLKHKGKQG